MGAGDHQDGRVRRQVDPTGGDRLGCDVFHVPDFATDDGETPIDSACVPRIEAVPVR